MAENRSALIVAVSEYQDAGLRRLVAPPQDAEALARVLGDPAIGGFAVKTLLDQPSHQVNQEIEAFFANRAKDDLLLLYFSGHGIKDEAGRLYFAAPDTDRRLLRTTAVSAALLHDLMSYCDSRRQVLLLDCCYSGAFARGKTHHKAGQTVDIGEYFGQGRGQFVLTASDALQYAFEGDAVSGEGVRSIFTDTLVQGLKTGEADLDGDGAISCDELYDYLHERVTDRMPQQKPRKWAFAVEGDIIIARNPHPVVKPAALPAELQQSIEDPRSWVREGTVRQLGDLLQHGNKGLAAAAHAALQQMTEDDSLKVRAVVVEILKARAENEAEAARKAEEVRRQTEAAHQTEEARKADAASTAKSLPPRSTFIWLVILVLGVLGGTGLYYYSTELEAERTAAAEKAAAEKAAAEKAAAEKAAAEKAAAEKAAAKSLKKFRDPLKAGGQGPEMIALPGGTFLMGSPDSEPERYLNEGPRRQVRLRPFAIGKTEVTFADYDVFAAATGRKPPGDSGWGRGQRPVINVNWNDAVAYAEWLSAQTGQRYRLPSEAEWEYAARAGTDTPFWAGDCIHTDQANYYGQADYNNCGAKTGVYRGRTVEAGSLPANAWGLHETAGNVWEWVRDCWHDNYTGAPTDGGAWEKSGCARRVVRGGGWYLVPVLVRSAFRGRNAPDVATDVLGFRLARD